MLKRKEADGLIFLGHRLPKEIATLMRTMAPKYAPVVNGCEFSPRLGIPSVHIDNAKAAGEAMAHLYSLGHRRIGIVTGPLVSPLSRDRLEGATVQAKKQGAERDFIVMNGDFSIESGAVAGARLLARREPPTATFCFNDEMAMGVYNDRPARRYPHPRGSVCRRVRRYPLRRVHESAADNGRSTDAGDWRGHRAPADASPEDPEATPEPVTLPHILTVRSSTAPATTRR